MLKFIKNILFAAAACYIGALAYFTYFQRNYIYHPTAPVDLETAGVHERYEALSVKSEDGLMLEGWYAPPTKKKAVILFFHGNAETLPGAGRIGAPYIDDGYGFLAAEYRGYNGLSGSPTENGVYADARAYIAKLLDMGVSLDQIIVMGHSLGAAVASQLAREFHPAGLIMLAPFKSVPAVAELLYPYFPVNFLVTDHFDNIGRLPTMNTPLLIIHGELDKLVPIEQGRTLFAVAQEPKRFESIGWKGHSDLFEDAEPIVLDWLDSLEDH